MVSRWKLSGVVMAAVLALSHWAALAVAAPRSDISAGTGSVLVIVLESAALDTLESGSVELAGTERGLGAKSVGPRWTRISNLPPGDHELEVGALWFGSKRVPIHIRENAEDTLTVVLLSPEEAPAGHRYISVAPAALARRPEDAGRFPADGFSFVLSTGRGERVDSSVGKVTKDMVGAPDTTITLVLTTDELDRIRRRMIEIRFFDMASPHPMDWPGRVAIPSTNLHLEATAGGATKRLDWNRGFTEDRYPSDDWKRLRDLVHFIEAIVQARPEYKALPGAQGAYL